MKLTAKYGSYVFLQNKIVYSLLFTSFKQGLVSWYVLVEVKLTRHSPMTAMQSRSSASGEVEVPSSIGGQSRKGGSF
jgi:hypothetical protein